MIDFHYFWAIELFKKPEGDKPGNSRGVYVGHASSCTNEIELAMRYDSRAQAERMIAGMIDPGLGREWRATEHGLMHTTPERA